ncbi:MAG: SDR family NAD(P)-dependent oxidoreductase [Pseudomonadota bacterium]
MSRVLLLTGASSGIGYAAAHDFHRRGWRVFATCRKEADVERLREEGLESLVLDVADEESCARAVDEVLERSDGRIDALVNNAAFACPGLVEDLPRGALRDVLETNLIGQIDLTRRVLPAMRAQGHGRIVMISSILGFVALRGRGAYISSKFALEGITDTLRLELAEEPLDVILIEPGPITSEIRRKARGPFERWIDWEASARRSFYETDLRPRLYKEPPPPDPNELPADAVTRKLEHALEARRPHPRYFVTRPTYIANVARRVLSTRLLDRILVRA